MSTLDDDPELCRLMVHDTEFMYSNNRMNIARLENSGVDIANLISACKVLGVEHMQEHEFDRTEPSEAKDIFESAGFRIPIEATARMTERLTEPAEKLSEKFTDLDRLGKQFLSIEGLDAKHEVLNELKVAYADTMEAWNGESRMYTRMAQMKTERYVGSLRNMERRMFRGGVWLSSLDDVKILGKIAKYGRIANGVFIFVNLGIDAYEVIKTYREGGDYKKKLAGLAAELIATTLIGLAFIALFAPATILGAVALGAGEGALISSAGQRAEEGGEKLYAKVFE